MNFKRIIKKNFSKISAKKSVPTPVVEIESLWGRLSTNLRMGIVGLPNIGKSTTFNCLSKLNSPAENFPFCTIEPNTAIVNLPDERFEKLCEIYDPISKISANLSITDIAGLVRGASKGEGMGNAFLSNIKEVDGIYHVVRAFQDDNVFHSELSVDPIRDIDIISQELLLKDLQFVEKRIDDLNQKIKRSQSKEKKEELSTFLKILDLLEANKWIRCGQFTAQEIEFLNRQHFMTTKPQIYLTNLSIDDYANFSENKIIGEIEKWANEHLPGPIIGYSAEYERDFNEMSQLVNMPSAIPEIIKSGYSLLQLINFFTVGPDEVRAWTIRKNTKAPKAAGVIHSDFEAGYISSDIFTYEDLLKHGSEDYMKKRGLIRQEGKEYIVNDGDIITFKFKDLSKSKN